MDSRYGVSTRAKQPALESCGGVYEEDHNIQGKHHLMVIPPLIFQLWYWNAESACVMLTSCSMREENAVIEFSSREVEIPPFLKMLNIFFALMKTETMGFLFRYSVRYHYHLFDWRTYHVYIVCCVVKIQLSSWWRVYWKENYCGAASSIFSFKPQIHFIKNDTNAAHVVTVLIGLVWLIIQRGSSMKQQSLKIMFLKDK